MGAAAQTSGVRAGRLVELLLLLQARGRMSAAQLAAELEVSERTIHRDIEALSGAGVPVLAIRGSQGGFELMEHYRSDLGGTDTWAPDVRRPARGRRAQVRISPEGRRLAAVLGRLQPIRIRRNVPADELGWHEATLRLESLDAVAVDLLSLGPEVEVLGPEPLRERVAAAARATAALYDGD